MINSQQACDWLVACVNDPEVNFVEQTFNKLDKKYVVSVVDKRGDEIANGVGDTLGGAFTDCALKFRTPRGLK